MINAEGFYTEEHNDSFEDTFQIYFGSALPFMFGLGVLLMTFAYLESATFV